MSDLSAAAAYAYLTIGSLVYVGSVGPRLPRAYLAAFWFLILAGFVNMAALSALIGDSDVSFNRGRRVLRWLRRRPSAVRGLLTGKVAS